MTTLRRTLLRFFIIFFLNSCFCVHYGGTLSTWVSNRFRNWYKFYKSTATWGINTAFDVCAVNAIIAAINFFFFFFVRLAFVTNVSNHLENKLSPSFKMRSSKKCVSTTITHLKRSSRTEKKIIFFAPVFAN